MASPWNSLRVADAHVHFFSSGFFQSLASQSGKPVAEIGRILGWELPSGNEDLAGAWVRQLDAHGVAMAALIASVPGDEDSVAAAVARYPGRFYGYAMLNPLMPDALARVERMLHAGFVQGICLFPAMHHYSMADARLHPILEFIAGHPGAIVFVHCGVLTVGVRARLGLPSRFDMRYSNPIDLHAAALEFPRLPVVIPHFGAGYFREALMLCDLCPNVYLDTSSSNSWMRLQPQTLTLRDVFRKAIEVAGTRRLLFGSDSSFFPRGWHAAVCESQVQVLQSLALDQQDLALIMGGNLERLLTRGEPVGPETPERAPAARRSE